jgi:hypothetical protein
MKKFFLVIALTLPSIGIFASNNPSQAAPPSDKASYRVIMTSCGTSYTAPANLSDQDAATLCDYYDEIDCN